MWTIRANPDFYSQLKKLGPEELRRFDQVVKDRALSEEPGKLGQSKKGRWSGYHAYDLGRSHRLIYKVLYKEKIVMIVAVGDHKQVYGKD